ncbi:MAG: cysteine--tRNA ligase [Chloroflexota bacterium]|jgi:cysteinyl-tRNA synthetase|nr:MAG: cysteine--tRNA ligase [SAR202 cluster bacterium]MEC7734022.1 cysteine--tRNA ligase [Chloroflexota bacterium]MEC8986556.1 cysteine--tRNA ligase [Chloroflexota bacterium]MED5410664.1 cysteine--tRNA ligase [Chloroflexota bacterium]MED5449684.1 cysteine--tRNA ligase [Chloroflexota bacterium]|tara:strand:- start:2948 stop:4306 length:1359 start_codon:yes stop_codon:yes gene_type:complete
MRLYNTLSRSVEELVVEDNTVNMYVCGITPYAPSHLGHAMCAIVFDVIRRYLEYKGYKVNFIQNFTDIDDKMIIAANDEGIKVSELAERNIQAYLSELGRLNVMEASEYPRATEEIDSIIQVITDLIEKGYAYEISGDVYFRVKQDEDYGKLSRRNIDDLLAGARLEIEETKENPADFALWKSQKPGEPAWDSPWGQGRPGWHIECTAMSLTYLNNKIDIHGGGQDLVFPHHENEIAQSESYTGVEPFARYWMHNGTLGYGEEKMSKSLGNVFSIGEALQVFSSDALRMFFLSSHYRTPLVFSNESVEGQQRAIERLKSAVASNSGEGEILKTNPYRERFEAAMDEDFNTPIAFSVIFDLARDINRESSNGLNVNPAQDLLSELAKVLGITLETDNSKADGDIAPYLDLLLEVREGLRKEKQFELSDQIRDRLVDLGVSIEDTSTGARWKLD